MHGHRQKPGGYRLRLCKNAGSVLKSALLLKICNSFVSQRPEICAETRFLFRLRPSGRLESVFTQPRPVVAVTTGSFGLISSTRFPLKPPLAFPIPLVALVERKRRQQPGLVPDGPEFIGGGQLVESVQRADAHFDFIGYTREHWRSVWVRSVTTVSTASLIPVCCAPC